MLANLDEYFNDELMIDPEILRSQEDDLVASELGNAALKEIADKQQDDPLKDLTPPKRVRSDIVQYLRIKD
jgi:hypothetical protein